jgi:hypothetical protein
VETPIPGLAKGGVGIRPAFAPEALAKGWIVVDVKKDWVRVYPLSEWRAGRMA